MNSLLIDGPKYLCTLLSQKRSRTLKISFIEGRISKHAVQSSLNFPLHVKPSSLI